MRNGSVEVGGIVFFELFGFTQQPRSEQRVKWIMHWGRHNSYPQDSYSLVLEWQKKGRKAENEEEEKQGWEKH